MQTTFFSSQFRISAKPFFAQEFALVLNDPPVKTDTIKISKFSSANLLFLIRLLSLLLFSNLSLANWSLKTILL